MGSGEPGAAVAAAEAEGPCSEQIADGWGARRLPGTEVRHATTVRFHWGFGGAWPREKVWGFAGARSGSPGLAEPRATAVRGTGAWAVIEGPAGA